MENSCSINIPESHSIEVNGEKSLKSGTNSQQMESHGQSENTNSPFEQLFNDVKQIDFEFDGNSLHIIGSVDEAKRISNKFKIMRKLAHLVGCGLDCHFRMAHDKFKLMMLVRGVPRALFGSTITVMPDVSNIRKLATAGGLVEAGQLIFFDKILDLVPQHLEGARRILQQSLIVGIENDVINKLYDFLKNIRQAILTHLSKIPILWTVHDFPSKEDDELNLSSVRRTIKQCGDNRLLELEKEQPGYTDRWFIEWNLGRVYTFNELMEQKFNELH